MYTLINDTEFVTASTTIEAVWKKTEKQMEEEFAVTDFGLKIGDRNIFYFLYMKDRLSYRRGFSIMIGDKTVVNWDNCK